MVVLLLVLNSFSLLSDGSLNCVGRGGGEGPGTTSCCSDAGTAAPNAPILVLPQKEQVCLARWRFHFLHRFPEGGTITVPVFAHDSSLVGLSCQVAAT